MERSPEALAVARENATALDLAGRITFLEGDLFAPLAGELRGALDLLVSNPPYLDPALKESLPLEVSRHEPAAALFAEERGLATLRRIVDGAGAWLKTGARLGLELSPEQAGAVSEMLGKTGFFAAVEVLRDAQQKERFVVAVRK